MFLSLNDSLVSKSYDKISIDFSITFPPLTVGIILREKLYIYGPPLKPQTFLSYFLNSYILWSLSMFVLTVSICSGIRE